MISNETAKPCPACDGTGVDLELVTGCRVCGATRIARTPADGPEPVAFASEYGMAQLAKRRSYCLSLMTVAEKEYQIPLYAHPVPVDSLALLDYPTDDSGVLQPHDAWGGPEPDGPAETHSDGRKKGHSKLVYNKQTRTIDKVDPHQADGPADAVSEAEALSQMLLSRIGSEFDGEAHLTAAEAEAIAKALRVRP